MDLADPVPPNDEAWRDLYAAFGNAVYWAQTLEHTLVNVLAVERLACKQRLTVEELDQLMAQHFRRTLGQLIEALEAYIDVPDDLGDRMAHALETRNLLVHRYFRVRVQQLPTAEGRLELMKELSTFREELRSMDQELDRLMAPFRRAVGISDEELRRDIQRLQAGEA